jgi:hypothetical protein
MGRWFAVAHAPQLDVDPHAGRRQHPDQGVDAEELDLPSNEIADPRLRDTEERRGIALPKSFSSNHIAHGIHQFGTQSQMRRGRIGGAGVRIGDGMRSGASRPTVALIARFRHVSPERGAPSIYKP